MDLNKRTTIISTLWIVVMFNMAFADIFSFFMVSGPQIEVSSGLFLGLAVILEIPIIMIILSRILKPKANRWVNTIASVITVAFVIGGGSLTPHYIFFATIEVICLALIVWLAWKKLKLAEGSL